MFIFLFFIFGNEIFSQLPCRSYFWKNNSCSFRYKPYYPQSYPPFEHWPGTNNNYIVYYNDNLLYQGNLDPNHLLDFDFSVAQSAVTWCREYWQSQCMASCSQSGISWETTQQGAELYFTDNPKILPASALARTVTAISAFLKDDIVRESSCGQEVIKDHSQSEILFNNSEEFYFRRDTDTYDRSAWTTNSKTAFENNYSTRTPAYLFQFTLLHEMGHYLGLPHDNEGCMRAGYNYIFDYWQGDYNKPLNMLINQCDADRFRRLYCVECIGEPPVSLDFPVSVQKQNVDINVLNIYPNPASGRVHVSFNSEYINNVNFSLYSPILNKKILLLGEYSNSLSHEFEFSTHGFPSGIYILILEHDGHIIETRKFIILK